jgi:DnaJ family protein C protein 25
VFQEITNAYEILRDEELKADYDEFLKDPYSNPSYYYASKYYYKRYASKIHPFTTISVLLVVTSIAQYFNQKLRHSRALRYYRDQPDFREKVLKKMKNDGWDLRVLEKKPKKRTQQDDEDVLKIENNIVKVLAETITGADKPASIKDILIVRLLISPYTAFAYLYWCAMWYYKFDVLKQPYGYEEQLYLTKRAIKYNDDAWEVSIK